MNMVDITDIHMAAMEDRLAGATRATNQSSPTRGGYDSPSSIEEAKALLSYGFYTAAAMVTRVALEQSLIARCKASQVDVRGLSGVRNLAFALSRAGKVSEAEKRRLLKLGATANGAAHGRLIDVERARELVEDATAAICCNDEVSSDYSQPAA